LFNLCRLDPPLAARILAFLDSISLAAVAMTAKGVPAGPSHQALARARLRAAALAAGGNGIISPAQWERERPRCECAGVLRQRDLLRTPGDALHFTALAQFRPRPGTLRGVSRPLEAVVPGNDESAGDADWYNDSAESAGECSVGDDGRVMLGPAPTRRVASLFAQALTVAKARVVAGLRLAARVQRATTSSSACMYAWLTEEVVGVAVGGIPQYGTEAASCAAVPESLRAVAFLTEAHDPLSSVHTIARGLDPHPALRLELVTWRRAPYCNWIEALADLEAWQRMRAGAPLPQHLLPPPPPPLQAGTSEGGSVASSSSGSGYRTGSSASTAGSSASRPALLGAATAPSPVQPSTEGFSAGSSVPLSVQRIGATVAASPGLAGAASDPGFASPPAGDASSSASSGAVASSNRLLGAARGGVAGEQRPLPAASPVPCGLEGDNVLVDNLVRLREKEDIAAKVYPYRSLYHGYQTTEGWEVRMGWRKRLVEWVRNLTQHFALAPPVFADAVALADRYVHAHGNSLGRSGMQLLYLTALCIASRVHRVAPQLVDRIRVIAPDYSPADYTAMEGRMVATMGSATAIATSAAASAAQGAAAAAAARVDGVGLVPPVRRAADESKAAAAEAAARASKAAARQRLLTALCGEWPAVQRPPSAASEQAAPLPSPAQLPPAASLRSPVQLPPAAPAAPSASHALGAIGVLDHTGSSGEASGAGSPQSSAASAASSATPSPSSPSPSPPATGTPAATSTSSSSGDSSEGSGRGHPVQVQLMRAGGGTGPTRQQRVAAPRPPQLAHAVPALQPAMQREISTTSLDAAAVHSARSKAAAAADAKGLAGAGLAGRSMLLQSSVPSAEVDGTPTAGSASRASGTQQEVSTYDAQSRSVGSCTAGSFSAAVLPGVARPALPGVDIGSLGSSVPAGASDASANPSAHQQPQHHHQHGVSVSSAPTAASAPAGSPGASSSSSGASVRQPQQSGGAAVVVSPKANPTGNRPAGGAHAAAGWALAQPSGRIFAPAAAVSPAPAVAPQSVAKAHPSLYGRPSVMAGAGGVPLDRLLYSQALRQWYSPQPDPRSHMLVPRWPAGVLARYSPLGLAISMPDVQQTVMSTPFAIASHLVCLVTRPVGERLASVIREALFVASRVRRCWWAWVRRSAALVCCARPLRACLRPAASLRRSSSAFISQC
jgi:hypothetical protein